jgi:hypothetical protein
MGTAKATRVSEGEHPATNPRVLFLCTGNSARRQMGEMVELARKIARRL